MTLIDNPRPVRAGEELPHDALLSYLVANLDASLGTIEIEQFPGGHSNLTYLIRADDGREWVLRRPPFGSKVKSAHDMGREHRVLSVLGPAYAKAPTPVLMCEDESVIGAPFYMMQRLRGLILRKRIPPELELDADTARKMCFALIDTLAELHALDYESIGLGDLGRPQGYVQRQVEGWTRRYQGSKTDDIGVVDDVARWLAANMPESGAPALIHNDFKFDNLVFDEESRTKVIGILDWEMTTVGDPLMDLGTALCYWVDPTDPQPLQMARFGPTTEKGMLSRRQVLDRYLEKSGRSSDNIAFYYAFGLFKTAVVAQQIYYRFHKGLTKDQRFAAFIHAVRVLCEQAARAIETGRVL